MHDVMVTVTVEDFDRFLRGFRERGLPLRRRHGSTRAQVLQHAQDPHRVSLLFEWESDEAFRGFLADPEVQASMRAGGTVGPPEITPMATTMELPA